VCKNARANPAALLAVGGNEHSRSNQMNEDRIKGQWKQLAGKLKAKWGKLTDDDLRIAEGNSEYLAGRIQERYGVAKDEAEKQVKEFDRTL
jgi:uncharacterized protein YjbJ (UPF0337 family)